VIDVAPNSIHIGIAHKPTRKTSYRLEAEVSRVNQSIGASNQYAKRHNLCWIDIMGSSTYSSVLDFIEFGVRDG
jgi:hypothetical protein